MTKERPQDSGIVSPTTTVPNAKDQVDDAIQSKKVRPENAWSSVLDQLPKQAIL